VNLRAEQIEDPCGKLQGISDRKETVILLIRSLTPPQVADAQRGMRSLLRFKVRMSQ